MQHGFQLLVALVVIAILKYRFVAADYGLRWPRGKTYFWAAILWGIFFGILMSVVDYAPHLIAHTKPDPGFPLTPSNVWGWIIFEGIYVGPTEEIPFRALLVTYLATTMPGKLHMGRFNMNWAGIIVALIFALLHANNFDARHWPEALGQQFYAFALGRSVCLLARKIEKRRCADHRAQCRRRGGVCDPPCVAWSVLVNGQLMGVLMSDVCAFAAPFVPSFLM
jgi:uncharacterized protein